ncbi:MAG: hypothetical protein AAB368_09830, partial [bacterium]
MTVDLIDSGGFTRSLSHETPRAAAAALLGAKEAWAEAWEPQEHPREPETGRFADVGLATVHPMAALRDGITTVRQHAPRLFGRAAGGFWLVGSRAAGRDDPGADVDLLSDLPEDDAARDILQALLPPGVHLLTGKPRPGRPAVAILRTLEAFDPGQLRDPKTGQWIDVGGAVGSIASGIGDVAGDIFGGIGDIFGFATGGESVVTKPTLFMAGESGAERVRVSPMAGASRSSGGITNVFHGPTIMDPYTMRLWLRGQ